MEGLDVLGGLQRLKVGGNVTLECSASWFLQPLERWVMLPCPVPTLEGLTGAKGSAWPWPNLDFLQQGTGNSLHGWKHQVLGPSQL